MNEPQSIMLSDRNQTHEIRHPRYCIISLHFLEMSRKKTNLERQKADLWFPRAGGGSGD